VLAVDDYGLRTTMQRLYGLASLPSPAQMRKIAEPWRPYRSYASLFLWRGHDAPRVAEMQD
jgi:DNA-3-methyladenine glycosylase II